MAKVKINGREYSWGEVNVYLLGKLVLGITDINYKMAKAKEYGRGRGNGVRAIQHGMRTPSGSVTLTQSEVIALNASAAVAGYQDILDVDFDIVVAYVSENSMVITVDKIEGASFEEIPLGLKQGDPRGEYAMPFKCTDILYDCRNNG